MRQWGDVATVGHGTVILEQYPPMMHSLVWLVVAGGCFVLAVVVALTARWIRRRIDGSSGPDGNELLERLRGDAVAELEAIGEEVRSGRMTESAGHRRIGQVLRRFIATVESTDLDFEGLDEIRARSRHDPRLEPVVAILSEIRGPAFDPGESGDLSASLARAEEVIRTW